jgi:hypothetical protein
LSSGEGNGIRPDGRVIAAKRLIPNALGAARIDNTARTKAVVAGIINLTFPINVRDLVTGGDPATWATTSEGMELAGDIAGNVYGTWFQQQMDRFKKNEINPYASTAPMTILVDTLNCALTNLVADAIPAAESYATEVQAAGYNKRAPDKQRPTLGMTDHPRGRMKMQRLKHMLLSGCVPDATDAEEKPAGKAKPKRASERSKRTFERLAAKTVDPSPSERQLARDKALGFKITNAAALVKSGKCIAYSLGKPCPTEPCKWEHKKGKMTKAELAAVGEPMA